MRLFACCVRSLFALLLCQQKAIIISYHPRRSVAGRSVARSPRRSRNQQEAEENEVFPVTFLQQRLTVSCLLPPACYCCCPWKTVVEKICCNEKFLKLYSNKLYEIEEINLALNELKSGKVLRPIIKLS